MRLQQSAPASLSGVLSPLGSLLLAHPSLCCSSRPDDVSFDEKFKTCVNWPIC